MRQCRRCQIEWITAPHKIEKKRKISMKNKFIFPSITMCAEISQFQRNFNINTLHSINIDWSDGSRLIYNSPKIVAINNSTSTIKCLAIYFDSIDRIVRDKIHDPLTSTLCEYNRNSANLYTIIEENKLNNKNNSLCIQLISESIN